MSAEYVSNRITANSFCPQILDRTTYCTKENPHITQAILRISLRQCRGY